MCLVGAGQVGNFHLIQREGIFNKLFCEHDVAVKTERPI